MQGLTPMTFDELTKALSQLEEGDKILAGGTDLIIQLNHSTQRPRKLLSLSNMLELQKITITPQQVQIGAMVTMTQIASTLQTLPELRALADAAADVGSPQVRNRATLAGNLCNASPAGDMLPVCWLLGAKIQILDSTGSLSLLPVENFILGPGHNALHLGQVVTAIFFNRITLQGYQSAFSKIGSREKVSISREGLSLALRCHKGCVEKARITVGAVASTPLRIPQAENALLGEVLSPDLAEKITPFIAQIIHDNCRPTNRLYKTQAARGLTSNLLNKLLNRL